MAEPGDIFTLSDGEKVTVRVNSSRSGGELLELDAEWAPLEHRPPPHYHPRQSERFEVREGELSAVVDGRLHVLRPGDALDVPAGAAHKMWNSAGATTRASWQVRPALRTEDFFATVQALRASGRHGKHGMLTPLGGGVLLRAFPDEFRLALPGVVQRPLATVLGGLARLRGYPRAVGQQ
jgi:mannose-6-phosphate isomerase-like protein (cupin superfamily)